MIRNRSFISRARSFAAVMALGSCTLAFAQSSIWKVQVLDAITGSPVQGLDVEYISNWTISSGTVIHQTSDSGGLALLDVSQDTTTDPRGRILVHGNSAYHYVAREDQRAVDTSRIFVMPYSAFHKSALISAALGTGNQPFYFSGQTPTPMGPTPYFFEVSVPPNVLPSDAQIWIAPRPLDEAINNYIGNEIPGHFGQFHIQLRDANGQILSTQQVAAPGLQIRFTPWFLPSSQFPIADNVIVNRLNTSTLSWDTLTPKGSFDPSTGIVTMTLRTFSAVDCKAERWTNALLGMPNVPTTPPTPNPPVVDDPIVEKDKCVTLGAYVMFNIKCGVVAGNPSRKVNQGTTLSISSTITAQIKSKFKLDSDGLTRLFAKVSAEAQIDVSVGVTGGYEYKTTSECSKSYNNGQNLGGSHNCASGSGRIADLLRKYTVGGLISFTVFEGIGEAYCIMYDESCNENCNHPPIPNKLHVESETGLKLCDHQWDECGT